jgi:flavin reductase (DIM6/NTAB) family NADH-FMN oxidoreductase RutF
MYNMSLKKINIDELNLNPFTAIGKEWFLLTAGSMDSFNTMTASWGGVGVMWGKNVVTTVVRSNRHTFEYINNQDTFTISFYPQECKDILNYCGSHSGKDVDKVAETGLKPIALDGGVAFEQSKLVFVCKKLYAQELDTKYFTDMECTKWYSDTNPIHTAFVGEIVAVYSQE